MRETLPEAGRIAFVRQRRYLVEEVVPSSMIGEATLVDLSCVNGGGIMLHVERPGGPVAAAQKCATHVPLSVEARGGGCTAWSFMRRADWRLSMRV